MPMKVNVGGTWKEDSPKVNVNGTWKDVDVGWVNVGGVWKPFFENCGAYQLLGDVTLTTATSQVDFTGLNLDKNGEYLLVSDIVSTGLSSKCDIYVNGNETYTNYCYQQIQADGTGLTGMRENQPSFAYLSASAKTYTMTHLKLTNSGYFEFESDSNLIYGGGGIIINKKYGSSAFTMSSITSLTIKSTNGSTTMAIGSRFQLYKIGGAS